MAFMWDTSRCDGRAADMLCRRIFEGFGGLKGVVNAAQSGKGPDHPILFRNSGSDILPADDVGSTPAEVRSQ